MRLTNTSADIFIPDNEQTHKALERTTHMAIAAHQDDIEIMAYDGIIKCFGKNDQWFTGVVVTNGSGSPRTGLYGDYSDKQMQQIRNVEQKKAASVGEYGAQVLLDYPSSAVKNPLDTDVIKDIRELVSESRPQVIYTHNLADKHDTHVGVSMKVIAALRELPKEILPQKVYGCEVWRGLDWLNDEEKVKFDVAAHPNLAPALLGVFDSQICGGKRYDLASIGRRLANATFAESHGTDDTNALIYAMDLTELIIDPSLDILDYTRGYINRFENDVVNRIRRMMYTSSS